MLKYYEYVKTKAYLPRPNVLASFAALKQNLVSSDEFLPSQNANSKPRYHL